MIALLAEIKLAFSAFGFIGSFWTAGLSFLGVFWNAVKAVYGATKTAAGFLSLTDVKHALAMGLSVFVGVFSFGADVLNVMAGVTSDISSWEAALAGVLTTIGTGLAKYLTPGTPAKTS